MPYVRRRANAVAALVAAAWVASCALQLPAPVQDRSTTEGARWKTYTVREKDTLYSIAWQHNLDYEALAEANGIEPPYIIRPGQRLVLVARQVRGARPAPERPSVAGAARQVAAPAWEPASPNAATSSDVAAAAPPSSAPTQSQSTPAEPTPATTQPPPTPATAAVQPTVADVPRPEPATAAPGKATPDAQSRPPAAAPRAAPAPAAQPRATASPPTASPGWRQPVTAAPVRLFGGKSQGFDYDLAPTTRVFAAHSGEVAYAGPGLGGFRHTVIVKAGDRYLVAYSLNAPPKLNEGDDIAAGDLVAEIGAGGADAGRLHFEIRERGSGQAVDPAPLIGR